MKWPRSLVVVAASGLLLLLLLPGVTWAHAALLRATPSSSQTLSQAPAEVDLLFSEPLDPVFSAVHVVDASAQVVDLGDSHVDPENDQLLVASLRPGLPNGVYTVQWRNLSAIDVHPDSGQYPLFVGVPVSLNSASISNGYVTTTTPETTFGRWWFYLSASLFGGVLAAWKLVLGPLATEWEVHERVVRVVQQAGQSAPVSATATVMRRRAYRLIVAGGALLIVGTLFTAVAQAAAAANVPLLDAIGKPMSDLLLRGRYAAIWWPRMGLEVTSLALIAFGGIDGLASECALATLPAVLLTSALTSHGAALPEGAAPGIAIDWLHIVGATFWIGGLIGLVMYLPVVRRASESAAALARLVARFGRYALVASMLVLLSGVLQGALEVGSANALVASLYGQLLVVKVVLLVAMLSLAVLNEWRARTNATVDRFGGGVRVELTLGVITFAVAALLSGTPASPTGG